MKRNTIFKRAYNDGLSRMEGLAIGCDLGSEPSWAAALAVSRTTVRSVFVNFAVAGLIEYSCGRKVLLRHPAPKKYFPEIETEPVATIVERRFLRWILQGDCRPGQTINALELSRQFGASNGAIRDYLNRLRHYGLVERLRGGGSILNGFTRDFAEELCDVRAMFELRSALKFIELADDDPAWTELARIEREHRALAAEADARFSDFSALDERFHRCVNNVSSNRFIVGFYDVISMIFHYHYQWNKRDEKERNIVAMREHLAYIDALRRRDATTVAECCRAHMATARKTLLASIPASLVASSTSVSSAAQ